MPRSRRHLRVNDAAGFRPSACDSQSWQNGPLRKSSEKIEREIEQLELALETCLLAVAEGDEAPIDQGQGRAGTG